MDLCKLFKSLGGAWDFHRTIHSQSKSVVLGVVAGTALITKMDETLVHYQEKGLFTTGHGDVINTTREYIYKYCPVEKKLEKFFSTAGKQNKLFYCLHFRAQNTESVLKADASHLCNKDNYEAEYTFFDGESFNRFALTYYITGPKKDYTSGTMFERQ